MKIETLCQSTACSTIKRRGQNTEHLEKRGYPKHSSDTVVYVSHIMDYVRRINKPAVATVMLSAGQGKLLVAACTSDKMLFSLPFPDEKDKNRPNTGEGCLWIG